MDLLEQCGIWNEANEYQKIIDALEAVPAGERTPEMDSELARAYNNIADVGDKAYFHRALALLKPHEEFLKEDHCFNFRMAYAWYYLDQEGRALFYFKRALAARPGDADTLEMIDSCRDCLALPRFEAPFRVRVEQAWQDFAREEEALRAMMAEGQDQAPVQRCQALLDLAFEQVSFALGVHAGRYQLVLDPKGDRLKLFALVYFQRRAPAEVLAHWDILVDLPDGGPALPQEAQAALAGGTSYRGEADEDPDADWRMDVVAGTTRCPALIRGYLDGESTGMDDLHADGAVAGFLCYPLDGFTGEDRSQAILHFRENLEEELSRRAGEEAVTLIGSAVGLSCGYVDFIAWDLPAVLEAAAGYLQDTSLPWAGFHVFRRDVATVRLLNREEETAQVHPQTGSLLSPEEIETLESFVDESTGYYGRMLDFIRNFVEQGVRTGRFTEEQARRDLQLALWYAYACNNMDEYEWYYRAAQWLPHSQGAAGGCGTWYYRYSVALTYCGRLEEALQYARQGALEEPDYPWIWLQVGKLCSHFGDTEGALEAVRQGLALVPGDYEFQTLGEEIRAGATLEEMEYHWINPEADRKLQQGLDEDADDKQRAISCITTSAEGLERFHRIFHPDPEDFTTDAPYCSFHTAVQGRRVELIFRMNQAGLSKLRGDWLQTQKKRLEDGRWLRWTTPEGAAGRLDTVLFGLDYQVSLIYQLEEEERYYQVWLNEDGTPGRFSVAQASEGAEYYSQEEMEAVEAHIQAHFGPFEQVWHELDSPDIHVDICLIPPGPDREYYTLVTMGMGAHRMAVPAELAEHRLERAELVIALPPDWQLGREDLSDERWYWPIRLLKMLARLPIQADTWLGWGHTMDHQQPFSPDTKLCGAMLLSPQQVEEGGEVCLLPGGEEVNFYQVIPLYRDEMDYKQAHGAEALLNRMEGVSFVVFPDRPDALDREGEDQILDDGNRQLAHIRDKGLPVEELAAWNHLAIFLRWCMEQDLMSLPFLERYGNLAQRFQEDLSDLDLRPFIRDELDGQLFCTLFDEEGEAFARWYCRGEKGNPCYADDIDSHARAYFGPQRYDDPDFQGEAYLFVPFEETYYQAMAQVIRQRWEQWLGQGGSGD